MLIRCAMQRTFTLPAPFI